MIIVFRQTWECLGKFDDYAQLTKFLRTIENHKLLAGHREFGQSHWSFEHYTRHQVKYCLTTLKDESHTFYETAAVLDREVIEICTGDWQNPQRIMVMSDSDVQALQQQWCRQYCQAHGYSLYSIPDVNNPRQQISSQPTVLSKPVYAPAVTRPVCNERGQS